MPAAACATAGVTSGNVHDAKAMDRLVRDDDTAVYGDKGYASDAKKRVAEAAGVLWAVRDRFLLSINRSNQIQGWPGLWTRLSTDHFARPWLPTIISETSPE